VIKWSLHKVDAQGHAVWDGLLPKVILPMIASPAAGLILGFVLMTLLYLLVWKWTPWAVNRTFGKLQLLSAGYMAWGHGFADAQKTMGVIALATFAATKAGKLDHLPAMFSFLYTPKFEIHLWIKITCAIVMGLGTWGGGWRIIRTLGQKLITMSPINGFAAEATGATILLVAGKYGMPVSTTHAITTSIMGVGMAKHGRALNLIVAERIVWAWIFTIPGTGILAFLFFTALRPFIG
jgi:PiT family inorganic phosphate transporter